MKNEPILRVEDLTKRFGSVKAVDGISFQLQRGQALGIIGPNGSGKSTLINLISGFVKPTAGKVSFQGMDITGIAPHKAVNLGIGRSFQLARPFYNMSVYKNVVIAVNSSRARKHMHGKYGDRDEVAIQLLEDVGFDRDSQIPYKNAGELPHGYLKRLELARCLALNPDLIILDELFSGMSLSEIAGILPLLRRIKDEGKTLVMVEHRLKELFQVIDKVIVLNFGRKIAEGTPGEVMQVEEVASAYLGSEVIEDA